MQVLADYYVHNLDPFVFRIAGTFGPRWYGLAYLMGFLVAYLLLKKLSRDGMLRLDRERVPDLVLNCCIFGVLMGGRMGFVLFYDLPDALRSGRVPLLWNFTPQFPFWGVIRVWDGGMSAHGGILFTILTLAYFARKYRTSFVNVGDAACMVVPVGLCFGRIANFINGELYGHPTTVPWAVKFPQEIYAPTNGKIDQAVYDKLPTLFEKLRITLDWTLPYPDMIHKGINTLAGRLMSHDPVSLRAVADILPPRHPSQLYESLLEGVLLFIICWTIGRIWRKDGMASGAFLTLYPVMRIIGEQFRVGDDSVQVAGWNISEGILLSLPLVLIGATFWGYWIKRDRRVPWVPLKAEKPPDPSAGKAEGNAELPNPGKSAG